MPGDFVGDTDVSVGRVCWCSEGKWLCLFRRSSFGLLRCSACGCYRIDPPPLQNEKESEHFYTHYYADSKGSLSSDINRARSRFWRVADVVPSLGKPMHSVVDVGCGEGDLCGELRAAGWETVVGVDVSKSRIARAKLRFPGIQFYDVPLDETPIQPRSQDLIVMDNVIEHLLNPDEMLCMLRRYLTPDGRIVLITPNMESGHFRLLGRFWTPELAPHTHIFLFTHASMRQLLHKTGFELEAEGSFHLPKYGARSLLRRLVAGDVKGAVWRSVQEAGAIFGRYIGAGPMLYAVARPDGAVLDSNVR